MGTHIAKDEIFVLFSYQTTVEEINTALAHIVKCPACWALAAEVVATLKRNRDLAPAKRGRPPEWPFRDGRAALIALMEIEEQESIGGLRAKGWWAELKELSPKEQADKVNSVAAVRQREVIETILREAKLACGRDPFSAEHLALTAHTLVDHLPNQFPAHIKNGLRLSAMTIVANSRRLAGNWQGSFAAISSAKSYLVTGTIEPSVEAYLLLVQASLIGDTGQLEDAVLLMRRASDIYRNARDIKGMAIVKIKAVDTLQGAGNTTEAMAMAEDALALLPPDSVRLEMLARSLITECMVTLGRLPEALRSYEATKPLYAEVGDELTLFKAEYLEAKLLDALGHSRESEKLFRSAIEGVTELEAYRISVLFRFAFFESLFKRGALGKAARLCEEAIELLEQTDRIHPQMRQVWRDLLTAVQAEALKEAHLAEMRDYLIRHWALPARRAPFARGELG